MVTLKTNICPICHIDKPSNGIVCRDCYCKKKYSLTKKKSIRRYQLKINGG